MKTKKQFTVAWITIFIISCIIFSFSWYVSFPYDYVSENYRGLPELKFGVPHIIFNIIYLIVEIVAAAYFLAVLDNKKYKPVEINIPIMKINYKYFWLIVPIALVVICLNFYSSAKFIYNKSVIYHNTYNQKVEEKLGFYDKLWKTYLQKEKITNLNKETFIQVTSLIMENRKDGSNLAWKWVHENQNIPYEEFTVFYRDLSTFIESQREQYFNIEKECQKIANQNNTLLDTLPNNLYNKVIDCKHIKFEYGFLSDSTNSVFKSKVENIK